MEPVLRELVQREGFEAVFTTLKGIVMAEYERANRDYQFFLKVTGEDKKRAVQKDSAAVQKDSVEATNTVETPVEEGGVQTESAAVQKDSEAVPKDSKTVEIVGNTPTGTKKIFRKKSKA